METLSILIESSSASSSCSKLAHGDKADDKEPHEKRACENSESKKQAHRKERVVKEAHEEDDSATVSFETHLLDSSWMASIEKKLVVEPKRMKVSSSKFSTSIHKVPHVLFRQDKNAYIPQVVSIGPLHYPKRKGILQDVEEHKWRYLNKIVRRKGKVWLKQCIAAVKELENKARECYSQVIELDSNPFVEMMVLDGCFIIELFRKNWFRKFEDDPLFKLEWLNCVLTIDLVMLENQIPFFILQTLFDLLDISCFSLEVAALKFLRTWSAHRNVQLPEIEITGCSNLQFHHLLDLLHKNIVFSADKEYPLDPSTDEKYATVDPWKSIRCASKLKEAGIKFKKRDAINGAVHFLDIKFDKDKGIIEIPSVYLGDGTNPILRNLIAFEQCYPHCKKYVTAYAYFMDCLINSSSDVDILVQKGIVKNRLGCDEDVALLFNKINKGVIFHHKSFYLFRVCEDIHHYCGNLWPKLRATLMHDYFKNPWAVISFIAAFLLLMLTMTQSFFSVFPKFAVGK